MANRNAGFTIIELMVVVAVIAILAWIAVPSYFSSLQESRRAEAHTTLLALAQAQEQWYSNNNTYTNTMANLTPFIPAIVSNNINQGNYTYAIPAADATSFLVQANAVAAQAGDAACLAITLNQAGVQAPAACWVN